MTNEKRREYQRKYREKNKERIKEQRMNKMRMDALADLESVQPLGEHVYIMRANSGREFIVGGHK